MTLAVLMLLPLMAAAGTARAEGNDVNPALTEFVASGHEAAISADAASAAPVSVENGDQKTEKKIVLASVETVLPPHRPNLTPVAKAMPVSRSGITALIAHHAAEQGVPVALASAVVRVESRFNPQAHNGPNVGLTQINVGTARALGYAGPVAGLYDPDTNLHYGLRYLASAYKLAGGDTCKTILKYQAGHRAVAMTSSARTYCAKVRTIMAAH